MTTLVQKHASVEAVNTVSNWGGNTAASRSAYRALNLLRYVLLIHRRNGQLMRAPFCWQKNEYIFDPAVFARVAYPATWPVGRSWPPQSVEDLLNAPSYEAGPCVGSSCYTNNKCLDNSCMHTLSDWTRITNDWDQHFELRETPDRGIGVFTKRTFKAGDILGWYARELRIPTSDPNAYCLTMSIGCAPQAVLNSIRRRGSLVALPTSQDGFDIEEEITVDACTRGNWTRFINHSCDAYTAFEARRVGGTRITGVVAVKSVPAGVELTIDYGYGYFRDMACRCRAATCPEKRKRKGEGRMQHVTGQESNAVLSLEKGMLEVQF